MGKRYLLVLQPKVELTRTRRPLLRSTSFEGYDSPAANQIIAAIALEVLMTDADHRLDHLQSVNPGLTDDQLDQIAETTEQWLDRRARDRIRVIARRCVDKRSDPRDVMDEWNTSEEIERLIGLLRGTLHFGQDPAHLLRDVDCSRCGLRCLLGSQ